MRGYWPWNLLTSPGIEPGNESRCLRIALLSDEELCPTNGTESSQNDPLATTFLRLVFWGSLGPVHLHPLGHHASTVPGPHPYCPAPLSPSCASKRQRSLHLGSLLFPSAPVARALAAWTAQISLLARPGSRQWLTYPKVTLGSPTTLPGQQVSVFLIIWSNKPPDW